MSERHFHKAIFSSLVLGIVGLCASCDRAVGASATTQPVDVIEWDFSDGTDLGRIKVPWTSPQEVQYVYGHKHVKLKVRAGLSGEVDVGMIQIWRDGQRIRGINLFTAAGTVEEVYSTAMQLADAWQIKERDNIERFRKTLGRTLMTDETSIIQHKFDPVQPRAIEIRHSFEPNERKWIAILIISFPVNGVSK